MKPPIRIDAEQTGYDKGYRQAIEDNVAALNEWREAGKEIGRKLGVVSERERIIQVLDRTYDWNTSVEFDRDELISLIKGEN